MRAYYSGLGHPIVLLCRAFDPHNVMTLEAHTCEAQHMGDEQTPRKPIEGPANVVEAIACTSRRGGDTSTSNSASR